MLPSCLLELAHFLFQCISNEAVRDSQPTEHKAEKVIVNGVQKNRELAIDRIGFTVALEMPGFFFDAEYPIHVGSRSVSYSIECQARS